MARIKYYYNTETCKYERSVTKTSDILLNLAGFVALSLSLASLLFYLYFKFFDSPKEVLLKKENEQLKTYYDIINRQLVESNEVLSQLQDRDDNIYRVIFETDPIPQSKRNAGVGGAEKYANMVVQGIDREKIIASTLSKVEELKRKIYIQSKSYDEIINLARNKEQMLASIPAIQPISNKTLKSLASGFGMRIHPIYKVKKFHTGIDFSAVRGTPVYATGDGMAYIGNASYDGYGRFIEVDHGFGFVTRYAHLDKINIKNGQKVKRGEVIGYVGSTGTATAPHLHYEVIKGGVMVNPIHYFFNDLSPKDYEELIELASIENQSLG
ncbi:MAG: M23 family metallopeptidase [Bacteroidota bacterium]|nr:M23 family metallopeptidase [Bacteroidota bacterium]